MSRVPFWEEIEVLSTGCLAVADCVEARTVLALSVPFPLPEQRRIVADRQIAARVEKTAGRTDRGNKPRSSFAGLRNWQSRPRAPRLAAPVVRRPVEIQPDEWYPELGIRSFGKGTFHKDPVKGPKSEASASSIEPGDLLFSNVFWEGALLLCSLRIEAASVRIVSSLSFPIRNAPQLNTFATGSCPMKGSPTSARPRPERLAATRRLASRNWKTSKSRFRPSKSSGNSERSSKQHTAQERPISKRQPHSKPSCPRCWTKPFGGSYSDACQAAQGRNEVPAC